MAYGMNVGEVNWYKNPGWKKTQITKYQGAVGMHYADANGDGWNDMIIGLSSTQKSKVL